MNGHLKILALVAVLLVVLSVAGSARATIWDPFSGFADISAVQAKVNGYRDDTFRQQYNLAFDHKLAPLVDFRLAYRYYKFDQDLELLLGGYREEIQPSGEIRWTHPYFTFSTSAFRREVTTPTQGVIITNNFSSSIKTTDIRYPLMELRYDQQNTWAPDLETDYDISNERWQFNADYDAGKHNFNYSYSNVRGQNVISNQTSYLTRHLGRWTGMGRPTADGRLELSGRYSFNYATTTNERPGSDSILELAPISVGLYALNSQPDLGVLDPRPGLADGNKIDPVLPRIDLGTGSIDHNLGADLGLSQAVAGMYIYMDRPSGNGVFWEMYGSDDNLTWTQIPVYSGQFFNPGLNRYELLTPTSDYRYVKAVNSGINEIALTYVTEIEVLREMPFGTEENQVISASHSLDGRVRYNISDKWDTSLDASVQYDENVGSSDDRTRWGLGYRLLFEPSRKVTHQLRWDIGEEGGSRGSASTLDNGLGYTLVTYPLETLRGTFSVSDRMTYLDGDRSQNILGSALEANATVLPQFNLTAAGGMSWLDDYLFTNSYNTWYVRGGLDAGLTNSLDFILDHTYQETRNDDGSDLRTRTFTNLGLDWRITRTVYFRGSMRQSTQIDNRWTKDLLLSWNITSKARLTGQLYEMEADSVVTNLRKSLMFNLELGSRSNIYLRLTELDLSGSGGTRTVAFQQGFRFGF